ncbi:CHRD domain-containing protein [Deinococcus cellulosilyticus]|uniref:CHRD domain-containing protein n=1 Tax=Deinococcus cellulosilyticus (strain DSM 18568 / NBRC 106333 / KACC 11606 / 5516J-15) TaxID=1223518 RepID=A0A511N1X8_DEIC1|nr:CHRD domain-containing protein [Deinococcus cellulosilyticus]GEM46478.1 CHRD domain-containing protein [Deinococcus cellulosilyticus NBRC 106333 = KACC 11606]
MNKLYLALGFVAFGLAACNNTPTAPGVPTYNANLTSGKEIPAPTVPNDYKGAGSVKATWDGKKLTVTGNYAALTGPATAAHIHEGQPGVAGDPVCPLKVTADATDNKKGTLSNDGDCALNEDKLRFGFYYVNIHTAANTSGEIRGQLTK